MWLCVRARTPWGSYRGALESPWSLLFSCGRARRARSLSESLRVPSGRRRGVFVNVSCSRYGSLPSSLRLLSEPSFEARTHEPQPESPVVLAVRGFRKYTRAQTTQHHVPRSSPAPFRLVSRLSSCLNVLLYLTFKKEGEFVQKRG